MFMIIFTIQIWCLTIIVVYTMSYVYDYLHHFGSQIWCLTIIVVINYNVYQLGMCEFKILSSNRIYKISNRIEF